MSFKKQYFFFLRPIVVYIHQRIIVTVTLLVILALLCCEAKGSMIKDSMTNTAIVAKSSAMEDQVLLSKTVHDLKVKNILVVSISSFCALIVIFFIIYRSRKQKEIVKLLSLQRDSELVNLQATMKGEERERVRIARELHDGIMVQLSAVQMYLNALGEKDDSVKIEKLPAIINMLSEATKDLRRSAHNLMPDMLQQEGLSEALRYFCRILGEGSKVNIDLQIYGSVPNIASSYELMIYRIIQELLQNVLKHAEATQVLVQLHCSPDAINITVEDNGKGINETPLNKGVGLQQIRQRIHSLHGQFSLNKNKPTGTSVYIEFETKYLQQINLDLYVN